MLSVLDVFRIGIGPSSSHTVGPMRIAQRFAAGLLRGAVLDQVARVRVELWGSLALTGTGHDTPKAVMLGLAGHDPETLDPDEAHAAVEAILGQGHLRLAGQHDIGFTARTAIDLRMDIMPVLHPNGMLLTAYDAAGAVLAQDEHYSTGGGFIASRQQLETPAPDDLVRIGAAVPYPFHSAAHLLALCGQHGRSVPEIVLANEDAHRPRADTLAGLDRIIAAMLGCIARGLKQEGVLPGGLQVRRRAPDLWRKLDGAPPSNEREQLFDLLNVYAMAVNEENAAGGRVVTAPTNGAAGIIPAVLRHYCASDGLDRNAAHTLLLAAGGIGILYKQRASISGAEMGCQGEVGVACSMAAGGLAAVWGGTPDQVANAAEIAMEHNLGLTCDPVGGLVQIPCIERNALGAVKAANAARLALHTDGQTRVSLDQVIETMRQTGLDMSSKYKETSQGGLAVNVIAC